MCLPFQRETTHFVLLIIYTSVDFLYSSKTAVELPQLHCECEGKLIKFDCNNNNTTYLTHEADEDFGSASIAELAPNLNSKAAKIFEKKSLTTEPASSLLHRIAKAFVAYRSNHES